MKRLPPWNSKKLEESYQAKEMEYGFAGSSQVRHRRLRQSTYPVQDNATSLRGGVGVEGGSHEGLCALIAGKWGKALGNETSPSILRFVKDQKSSSR